MASLLTISKDGKRAIFTTPCSDHPSGVMIFRWTEQMTRKGQVPQKVCVQCQQSFPVVVFLKKQSIRRDGYAVIKDGPQCHVCQPPPTFQFHYKNGRLAMRLELRDENGQPIDFWDEKARRWVAMKNIGLRKSKGRNTIWFQPYADRQYSKSGVRYGK